MRNLYGINPGEVSKHGCYDNSHVMLVAIFIYFVSKLIRDCNSFTSQASMTDQEIVPPAELQIQV